MENIPPRKTGASQRKKDPRIAALAAQVDDLCLDDLSTRGDLMDFSQPAITQQVAQGPRPLQLVGMGGWIPPSALDQPAALPPVFTTSVSEVASNVSKDAHPTGKNLSKVSEDFYPASASTNITHSPLPASYGITTLSPPADTAGEDLMSFEDDSDDQDAAPTAANMDEDLTTIDASLPVPEYRSTKTPSNEQYVTASQTPMAAVLPELVAQYRSSSSATEEGPLNNVDSPFDRSGVGHHAQSPLNAKATGPALGVKREGSAGENEEKEGFKEQDGEHNITKAEIDKERLLELMRVVNGLPFISRRTHATR